MNVYLLSHPHYEKISSIGSQSPSLLKDSSETVSKHVTELEGKRSLKRRLNIWRLYLLYLYSLGHWLAIGVVLKSRITR